MSAIFKELVLTWKGTEYRVKPTMALLNKIEQTCSISSVATRMLAGNPPLTVLAFILSQFLTAAGAKDATSEDVYLEMMNDHDLITHASQAIVLAAFPNLGKAEALPPTAAAANPVAS